jgi:diacylglycerol kinase family enzyme
VTVVRAREVEIEADRSFAVYADGDHLADLPAMIRVLPRALDVIAPPAHAAEPTAK